MLDPKHLFFGRDRSKTRVSVINLSGLASDEARGDFVNRLQMTLFGWVKKHPSPRGLLYVIDEAQVFIPSGASTLSKFSGVQLKTPICLSFHPPNPPTPEEVIARAKRSVIAHEEKTVR